MVDFETAFLLRKRMIESASEKQLSRISISLSSLNSCIFVILGTNISSKSG